MRPLKPVVLILMMTMRNYILIVILIPLFLGCSGLFPSLSLKGKIVTPEYLSTYEGGGSLSTLWYYGSDDKYHYFKHFVKTTTAYRIKRNDLIWKKEFPKGKEKPVLVEHELSEYVHAKSEQGHSL